MAIQKHAKSHALSNLRGHIQVICGPMFAGKSEELLRQLNRLKYAHVDYKIFKPKLDTRVNTAIKSRDGRCQKAIEIKNSFEVFDHLQDIKTFPFVVAFDEVQFLDQNIVEVVKILSDTEINVIIAGLDTDSNYEPFGSMGSLLAIADEVKKLDAICLQCGRKATRTQRLLSDKIDQAATILIGDQETYEARCISCHQINLKKAALENIESVNLFQTKINDLKKVFYQERKKNSKQK